MMEGGGREPSKNSESWVSSPELLIQQVLEMLRNLQLNKLPKFRTTYSEKRLRVSETPQTKDEQSVDQQTNKSKKRRKWEQYQHSSLGQYAESATTLGTKQQPHFQKQSKSLQKVQKKASTFKQKDYNGPAERTWTWEKTARRSLMSWLAHSQGATDNSSSPLIFTFSAKEQ